MRKESLNQQKGVGIKMKKGEYDAIIRWNEETASFVADTIEGDCVSGHLYGAGLCEVIGNIHENPELMELGE
tara:strand:+ start:274 stop:489 length:216 start_codon:yes stop_codon:yes gene_type:complete